MPENNVDWPSTWSPADNKATSDSSKPSSTGFWGAETKSEEKPPANSSTEAAETGKNGFWSTESSAQPENSAELSKTNKHGFWGETASTSSGENTKGNSGFWGTESSAQADKPESKGNSGFWGNESTARTEEETSKGNSGFWETESTTKVGEPTASNSARAPNYGFWDKDTSADAEQPTKPSNNASIFKIEPPADPNKPLGFGANQPPIDFSRKTVNSNTSDQEGFNFEGEVHLKLSDLQGDENSPLYSVTNFEQLGINEKILQGIYAMNFKKPSKIQEKALPILLNDPPINMIAQSQSGTGKTAAFVITILQRLDFTKTRSPQALILAPSRELARQLETVVRQIGTFLEGLTIQCAVPGSIERDAPVECMIVVGTPGTVMDIIRRRQVLTSELKILCLDEADNMLDMQGLGDQCLRVKNLIPTTIQTILFSATFPDPVWEYARLFSPDAAEITLPKDDLTVSGISQMFIDCPSDEGKYEILAQLYGMMTIGSSIIFVKRRDTADRIAERLVADGHTVVAVHGAYDGADRDRILEEFRAGKAKVLITTNVLARGIDVSTVSMVINYDIPMKGRYEDEADPETYLHRIGRTGRFGRTGVSISFVFDRRSFFALSAIANAFNIDLVRLDHENWDQAEKVIQAIIKTTRSA